jgi:hypothetical protein
MRLTSYVKIVLALTALFALAPASANLMPQTPGPGIMSGNCLLPWGGQISAGTSVTAYSSATPAGACSSFSQTRTCTNGTLSGSYTSQSCTNGCTGTPWGSVSTGYSNTAYSSSAPPGPCSSYAQTRTCTAGTMSGTYTNTSCTNGCASTAWGSLTNGQTATGYSSQNPANTCAAVSATVTCNNGTMTNAGSYPYASCSNGCSTPYGWVSNGWSTTGCNYASSPACSNACACGTNSCSNGSYSQPYGTYSSCSNPAGPYGAYTACSTNAQCASCNCYNFGGKSGYLCYP